MSAPSRTSWITASLLFGLAYFLIGRGFAAVPTTHVLAWRYAAWAFSAACFAAHIGYECFRLRRAPLAVALHTAVAVAMGAFLLAVAGMIHSGIRPAWLLALVAWPAFTAVPAFLVALAAAALLRLLPRSVHAT
jgi:hypothetical protein